VPENKELFVYREPSNEIDTPGIMVFNNEIICQTLEDIDRDMCDSMTVKEIQAIKIYGQTAIPYGRYELKWKDSPTFGRVPQIVSVKGFSNILIHIGNWHTNTSGCILVGMKKGKNMVERSAEAMKIVKRLIIDNDIKFINVLKQK
jgi:hypothetical protein